MALRHVRHWLLPSTLLLAACGDVFGPDTTEYRLTHIDQTALPYHINYEDPTGPDFPQYILDRGGLSLEENGEYHILVSGRIYLYFERTWDTFTNSGSGRYTITGDTIRFLNEMGAVSETHPYGWFEDGRLHLPTGWFCTCVWTFEEIT